MGSFACQDGCRRDCCQLLRCAADQGQAAARSLNTLASLLQEAVSHTDDIRRLIQTDEVLERALSQALRSELAFIRDLCR